jgi:hypothetical protein
MSHDAKIEASVRRRWPDGQIEPWRRPVEVFRLIELELKAMGRQATEGGLLKACLAISRSCTRGCAGARHGVLK